MKNPRRGGSPSREAQELLQKMTPEERFDFVRGLEFSIRGIPRLGIPEIFFSDATGGLRRSRQDRFTTVKEPTAFPAPLLMAAAWSKATAWEYARAVGEESRALGFHFLLGPGLNIYRIATCGRNFEYLGEDPFLTSELAAGYVTGMQSTGTAATIKHFVANNTDHHRRSSNSLVSRRALREIYFPGFIGGIKAGAAAVMTSYNLLNGEWCGQSREVIQGMLKEELGFEGMVMTDWDSVWHPRRIIDSGQDLEMPWGESLEQQREALVGDPAIDRMVKKILETCLSRGFYDAEFRDASLFDRWEAHAATALKVNREGIVMLRNEGLFPLKPQETAESAGGTILITGNAAAVNEIRGSGSAQVAGNRTAAYRDALEGLFGRERLLYRENPTDQEIQKADRVFLFTGFIRDGAVYEGEFEDRPWKLPENDLIQHCTRLNPRTAVGLVCGGGVAMDWADQAGAIFHLFYGGETAAEAFVSLITGEANPSGKLPFTMEKDFRDSPGYGYDNITVQPLSDADQIPHISPYLEGSDEFVWDEKGRAAAYDVSYDEGIFVGYRWYEKKGILPRYPFGFGLSYTTFTLEDIQLRTTAWLDRHYVQVRVINTGDRAGAEVVQLYTRALKPAAVRPEKELKAFRKVHLKPGEVVTLSLEIDADSFAYYDDENNRWRTDPGEYEILVGTSSADIAAVIPLSLPQDIKL